MSGADAVPPPSRLDRLREDFDRAFAAPPPPEQAPHERLLLVSVGGSRLAVPFTECAGVARAANVTPLPAREHGFIGLVSADGVILPVYDLAALVDRDAAIDPRRAWLLVSAGAERVAFLVDTVDGQAARERRADAQAALITVAGIPRRYVSLAAILATLSDSVRRTGAARSVR